jgi:hypothetical protein
MRPTQTGHAVFAYHAYPGFALANDEEIRMIQMELGPGGGFEEIWNPR